MKQIVLKPVKLLSFPLLILLVYSCSKVGIGGPSYTVDGNANGAQVVPVSNSMASGLISGSYDGAKNTLSGTIKWTGLSGSPTAIHIHGGGQYKNGYPYFVMVNLPKGTTDSLNFTSAFTESLEGGVAIGSYYFDIHTSAFPDGEIRGHIVAH